MHLKVLILLVVVAVCCDAAPPLRRQKRTVGVLMGLGSAAAQAAGGAVAAVGNTVAGLGNSLAAASSLKGVLLVGGAKYLLLQHLLSQERAQKAEIAADIAQQQLQQQQQQILGLSANLGPIEFDAGIDLDSHGNLPFFAPAAAPVAYEEVPVVYTEVSDLPIISEETSYDSAPIAWN